MIETTLAALTLLAGTAAVGVWLHGRGRRSGQLKAIREAAAERSDLLTVLAAELGERQALLRQAVVRRASNGDAQPVTLPARPLLIVLHGPSGVGKDALIDLLRQRTGIPRAISSTSRPPRPDEREGEDYHFYSREEFERKIRVGEFAEWAEVYGDLKGLETGEVLKPLLEGRDVLIRTDIQGARTWRAKTEGMAITVAVLADDPQAGLARQIEIVKARMSKRDSETAETLERRLSEIERELADIGNNDYVIVNGEGRLEDAVRELEQIIQSERVRRTVGVAA